ncbi:hypothetical protein VNO80_33816 [Phaseolus coccineus]|uniref:Uncharacterized protein n=1 Tax=Phaseolus coccineus TaxID=3886 RepID=A0AAN9Q5S1_PHACN
MESRWKSPLPPTYGASLLECGLWVQRTPGASQKNRSIFLSLPVEHFVPSCSSIGNQDKPGTTVRRENTRSHSDLDMWNRLAPYVLKLFGRHGKSSEEKKEKVLLAQVQIERGHSVLVGLGSVLVIHRARALTAARSYCMHGSDDILIARASRFGLRGSLKAFFEAKIPVNQACVEYFTFPCARPQKKVFPPKAQLCEGLSEIDLSFEFYLSYMGLAVSFEESLSVFSAVQRSLRFLFFRSGIAQSRIKGLTGSS